MVQVSVSRDMEKKINGQRMRISTYFLAYSLTLIVAELRISVE